MSRGPVVVVTLFSTQKDRSRHERKNDPPTQQGVMNNQKLFLLVVVWVIRVREAQRYLVINYGRIRFQKKNHFNFLFSHESLNQSSTTRCSLNIVLVSSTCIQDYACFSTTPPCFCCPLFTNIYKYPLVFPNIGWLDSMNHVSRQSMYLLNMGISQPAT